MVGLRRSRAVAGDARATVEPTLDALVGSTARGDTAAFEMLYGRCAPTVFGVILRVLRDPAQSEEVAQEVLLEIWRKATRFDASRGSASAWIAVLAHRRAVDRVRAAQAANDREVRAARLDVETEYDQVAGEVESRLERERVRHCLRSLTDIQRESVTLAYYSGYTYREVADLLDVPLGTVKTRMRDGLIRLRDCLGVTA